MLGLEWTTFCASRFVNGESYQPGKRTRACEAWCGRTYRIGSTKWSVSTEADRRQRYSPRSNYAPSLVFRYQSGSRQPSLMVIKKLNDLKSIPGTLLSAGHG